MNLKGLLNCLEYSESSYYLSDSRLNEYHAYSHAFRLAKRNCGLRGVYTLRSHGENQILGDKPTPVVYVCTVKSEKDASRIHKLVWNQNTVPFLLVETPNSYRLYSGFSYDTKIGENRDQHILKVAKKTNEVLSKLAEFKARSINDGGIWRKWGDYLKQRTRVDSNLLKNLKSLSGLLQESDLPRNIAHSLIGKFVYLHYLKDREILSDRKLSIWKIEKDTIFGRNATLEGFHRVNEELDNWLNGTVFPIQRKGPAAPNQKHIRMVASIFSGDDPVSGQMHLDFKAYDFSHIPIETLSIVYQQFLHSENRGRGQGAFYTPIHIVNFILDELNKKRPLQRNMKVLDAACGSGAFLVQCYRRLIEREILKEQGREFSPFDLRKLLVDHIHGVDVDEDACGVTELSLIITLLDYVDPPDLEKEAYKNFELPPLRNRNIFYCPEGFFDPNSEWRSAKPENGYDWIVGNPPWKQLNNNNLEKGDHAALAWKNENEKQFPITNNQLAEAFAWEVSQHISEKGIIGLLMPAGTLFKKQVEFRRNFFSYLNIWCVVNFSNLRHILFQGAVNPAAAFFYSNSQRSNNNFERIITYAPFAVNQLTQYEAHKKRVEKLWTVIVNANEIKEILPREAASGKNLPWKIAMWGSPRDRHLLVSLAKRFPSLSEYKKVHGLKVHPGLELRTKTGKEPVDKLLEVIGKEELDMNAFRGLKSIFAIPPNAFRNIDPEKAFVRKGRGPKPFSICQPPHILVDAARRFAIYSEKFFVIPPRQIGITGTNKNLLKALALYLSSEFAVYQQFLTSTSWGIERDRPDKTDLENLPIPLDELSNKELSEWTCIYDELAAASLESFRKIKDPLFEKSVKSKNHEALTKQLNDAVYRLLGVDKSERWLIKDLLGIRKHLNEGRLAKEALDLAKKQEIKDYAATLKKELDDFLNDEPQDQHRIIVYYNNQLGIVEIEHPEIHQAEPVTVYPVKENSEISREFNRLRDKLSSNLGQWVYFNRNMKLYFGRTTYFFKPIQRFCWLRSQALNDADEFIADKIT